MKDIKYAASKVSTLFADELVNRLDLASWSPVQFGASFYLRPLQPDKYEIRDCDARVLAPGSSIDDAMMALLEALVDEYPVCQGMIAAFPSLAGAETETTALLKKGADADASRRQWEDHKADVFYGTKLRRLYPVTIIGKEIWESLPPLPAIERPPEVRDLGDCKMLIAWPELCSPHDPEFLAGTRELRQWLWPHTIQNPYDKLDLDV